MAIHKVQSFSGTRLVKDKEVFFEFKPSADGQGDDNEGELTVRPVGATRLSYTKALAFVESISHEEGAAAAAAAPAAGAPDAEPEPPKKKSDGGDKADKAEPAAAAAPKKNKEANGKVSNGAASDLDPYKSCTNFRGVAQKVVNDYEDKHGEGKTTWAAFSGTLKRLRDAGLQVLAVEDFDARLKKAAASCGVEVDEE